MPDLVAWPRTTKRLADIAGAAGLLIAAFWCVLLWILRRQEYAAHA
jgi:hypothetical protein